MTHASAAARERSRFGWSNRGALAGEVVEQKLKVDEERCQRVPRFVVEVEQLREPGTAAPASVAVVQDDGHDGRKVWVHEHRPSARAVTAAAHAEADRGRDVAARAQLPRAWCSTTATSTVMYVEALELT